MTWCSSSSFKSNLCFSQETSPVTSFLSHLSTKNNWPAWDFMFKRYLRYYCSMKFWYSLGNESSPNSSSLCCAHASLCSIPLVLCDSSVGRKGHYSVWGSGSYKYKGPAIAMTAGLAMFHFHILLHALTSFLSVWQMEIAQSSLLLRKTHMSYVM